MLVDYAFALSACACGALQICQSHESLGTILAKKLPRLRDSTDNTPIQSLGFEDNEREPQRLGLTTLKVEQGNRNEVKGTKK